MTFPAHLRLHHVLGSKLPLLALLLPVLLLASGPAAEAEAQTIRGTVISDSDEAPVSQAAIQIRSVDEPDRIVGSTTSNQEGEFTIWVRQTGVFTIRVQALGYDDSETTGVQLGSDEVKTVEIRMAVDAVEIEGLEVVGQRREPFFMRGVRERAGSGWGTVYTREELDWRTGANVQDILRTQPGMTILNQGGLGGQVGIQTGRTPPGMQRECFAAVYRDGIRVYDASQPFTDDVEEILSLPASEIEAMEVYRGAAQVPAEFSGTGSECGVVAVWTRRDIDRSRPGREDLLYRVRVALGGHAGAPSGDLAPNAGAGLGGSMHVYARDRLSIGFVAGASLHDLSAATVADFSNFVDFGGSLSQGSIRIYSAGLEPRVEFLQGQRVQPLVQGRLSVVRRSAHLGTEANRSLSSFSSMGWGVGAGGGVLFNATPTLGVLATLDVDRYSFGPYQDLRTETEATWTSVGLQLGASWSFSPLGEGF